MSQITLSNRDDLLKFIKKPTSESVMQSTCPYCQEKKYAIFVKGVKKWIGCKCAKATAINKKIKY